MKVILEFNSDREQGLKALVKTCGVEGLLELINNSLTLLEWAVGEEKSGRHVASVDEIMEKYEYLRMPILDKIREDREAKIRDKGSHLKVIK